MLQEQYEKHNLEMQPYLHYLAEYQKMKPEDIGCHLEIPYDEREGLFRLRFMEKNYTVSHPELEIHCLDGPDGQAVLCRIFMPKFWCYAISRKATICRRREVCFPTGSSLGEVYYGSFTGAA